MPVLTVEILCLEAERFSIFESQHSEPSLYGVTDGKAVGTYLEHKFRTYLIANYEIDRAGKEEGVIAIYKKNQ
jgi:hypothetical protein